ncbi:hypothetical protein [Chryseobacterium sp. Leaf394]|uniref:hypothetical protein n=1 Tax=Chryseobacterium sp. Leaf394 TaxID=1736361 RepID=UPI0006FE948B|nr:hypothetical protein [Chryseobacterium sp. Leaf394]KQS92115.1 hypothetical protein ASG21_06600 [Chryseobacterium sp. Leaf394]
MNALNLLKKYIIDSQIFVSLMGTFFAVFFMLEQQTFRWPTVALIFITYFSGYLYTKYQKTKYFPKILVLNFVAGIASAVLIILNHNEIRLIKWFIIVVLGLLYNSFFLETYIRKIPLLKVFYVGLVWGLMNCWLTLSEFSLPIFLISFLFITALVLPFDIRDMKSDTVKTFPMIIGVQNTKYLAYFLVFAATILGLIYLKLNFSISFFLTLISTFILIYFSENSNRDSYFSFWVELCSGLPLLFLILSEMFYLY